VLQCRSRTGRMPPVGPTRRWQKRRRSSKKNLADLRTASKGSRVFIAHSEPALDSRQDACSGILRIKHVEDDREIQDSIFLLLAHKRFSSVNYHIYRLSYCNNFLKYCA
jgi:hypothetical protein